MESKEREKEEFDAQLEELMKPDSPGKGERIHKKWSRKKKVAAGAVAGVLFLGILAKACSGSGNPQVKVQTTGLEKGSLRETLVLTGPVSGTDSVDVVSKLHSEVKELNVKEGDKVTKGQILAVLDADSARKALEIAQNAYDLAVADYEEQKIQTANGYAKAVQDYQTAKGNYDRNAVLFQSGDISQVDLQTAENAMNDARREMESYRLEHGSPVPNESYLLKIKEAEYNLDTKREELEDTSIAAPIDGTVVRVNTKVGRFADDTGKEGEPMFIIENLENLEMEIQVSEYSIGKVAVGQKAVIRADILNGDTVSGEVTAISPTGEEKSGSGSKERVIPTTIRINDKNTKLIAGITAKAELTLNEVDHAWLVPISSVVDREDGAYIAEVNNGTIRWIPVERGIQSDIQMEIRPREESVLTEGMKIVMTPDITMTDGMEVLDTSGV